MLIILIIYPMSHEPIVNSQLYGHQMGTTHKNLIITKNSTTKRLISYSRVLDFLAPRMHKKRPLASCMDF